MGQPFFQLQARDVHSPARAGVLHTAHGPITTPVFMPVGTQGTVKALTQQHLLQLGPEVILGNTYHLYLRPGTQVLQGAGGLHRMMGWPGALLTDSGGYQVYSLAHRRKLDAEGVTFASHIDGSAHRFTPESAVATQRSIGSDIQMVLDECPPYPSDRAYAEESLRLTHSWAARARRAFLETEPLYGYPDAQFGIVQGATYPDLRVASCQHLAGQGFEGLAIGGLAVGEPEQELYDLTELCCTHLPTDKPRYLMGVGTPWNILECIARGVDMMDCVLPSRNARHGLLYYWDGVRNLKNARYAHDHTPIDPTSALEADTYYTKAYLRHLFVADEWLALTLATLHNLHFFLELARQARQQILLGTFRQWCQGVVPGLRHRHTADSAEPLSVSA